MSRKSPVLAGVPLVILITLSAIAPVGAPAYALTAEEARAQLDEAQRLAGQRDHAGALETFAAVKAANPDAIEAIDGLKMGVVFAYLGDEEAIRSHARWLAERYDGSEVPTDAERSVKGYLVYAGAQDPDLLAEAVERTRLAVERAAAQGEDEFLPWFYVSLGLAKYRVGQYDAAAKWFGMAVEDDILYVRSLALPFAALAQLELGNRDKAEALLGRARAAAAELPEPGTEEYAVEWTDTLATTMAMAEAEARFEALSQD